MPSRCTKPRVLPSNAPARVRGPSLIEGRTYRYREHSEGIDRILREPYRSEEEVEAWRARDPIKLHQEHLLEAGVANQAEIDEIAEDVETVIAGALQFARESPNPEPEELFDDLFTNPIPIERS